MKLCITIISLLLLGCSSKDVIEDRENIDYVYRGSPAVAPPGVVRYCWEEPVVEFNREGPGVDQEGTWYRPAAVIGRQVRQGRWRPCAALPDETRGQTK